MTERELTEKVIGCAIEVHRLLGPGLLESTYQQCLAHELKLNAIPFRLKAPLPVDYKGAKLDCGYRLDMVVDEQLIVELKAVDQITGLHQAQLMTYMKLSKVSLGLLINFNVTRLVDGVKRMRV
ncbi:GxxExxY protein [Verrucomicrobia bacterium]|nr:GxxExxY protein [Verrucomicrobiota bacterium]